MTLTNHFGTSSQNGFNPFASLLSQPAVVRFVLAVIASFMAVWIYGKQGRLGLTDRNIQKLLFALCTPIARLEYGIIRFRALTANFLGMGQAFIAV